MKTIEQGLIDIRNKAREIAQKSSLGALELYPISCGTLIMIIDALEKTNGALEHSHYCDHERCGKCENISSILEGEV